MMIPEPVEYNLKGNCYPNIDNVRLFIGFLELRLHKNNCPCIFYTK